MRYTNLSSLPDDARIDWMVGRYAPYRKEQSLTRDEAVAQIRTDFYRISQIGLRTFEVHTDLANSVYRR